MYSGDLLRFSGLKLSHLLSSSKKMDFLESTKTDVSPINKIIITCLAKEMLEYNTITLCKLLMS